MKRLLKLNLLILSLLAIFTVSCSDNATEPKSGYTEFTFTIHNVKVIEISNENITGEFCYVIKLGDNSNNNIMQTVRLPSSNAVFRKDGEIFAIGEKRVISLPNSNIEGWKMDISIVSEYQYGRLCYDDTTTVGKPPFDSEIYNGEIFDIRVNGEYWNYDLRVSITTKQI